ncbi:MAG: STAS domain-containing protein [Planctomycetales bacterium]
MQVTMETFGKVLVAHTPDDLNADTAPGFLDALARPIDEGQTRIVLQMDRSETYDSAGLAALLDLQDQLREQGGQLKISGLGEPGRKIFEITRLDRRFDLFDSVIDAVDSFR